MMDSAYQQIATEIVSFCPRPFERTVLRADLGDGFSRLTLTCVDANGRETPVQVPTLAASAIDDALVDLQKDWPTQPAFSRCTFTLAGDGTFTFDVGDAN
jgi:hypothetical protein